MLRIILVSLFVLSPFGTVIAEDLEQYVPEILIEGKWGSRTGEFGITMWEGEGDYPKSFVVDSNEYIYILDHVNNRIQKFDKKGKYIASISVESYRRSTKKEIQESKKTWNKLGLDFATVEATELFIDENDDIYLHQKRHEVVKSKTLSNFIKFNNKGKLLERSSELELHKKKNEKNKINKKSKYKMLKKEIESIDKKGKKQKLTIIKEKYDGLEIKDVKFDSRGNFYIISGDIIRKYNENEKLLAEIKLHGYPTQITPPYFDNNEVIYYLEYIPDKDYPEFPADAKGIRLIRLKKIK